MSRSYCKCAKHTHNGGENVRKRKRICNKRIRKMLISGVNGNTLTPRRLDNGWFVHEYPRGWDYVPNVFYPEDTEAPHCANACDSWRRFHSEDAQYRRWMKSWHK